MSASDGDDADINTGRRRPPVFYSSIKRFHNFRKFSAVFTYSAAESHACALLCVLVCPCAAVHFNQRDLTRSPLLREPPPSVVNILHFLPSGGILDIRLEVWMSQMKRKKRALCLMTIHSTQAGKHKHDFVMDCDLKEKKNE